MEYSTTLETAPLYLDTSFSPQTAIGIGEYYYQKEELVNITLTYPEELLGKIFLEIYNLDSPEYFYRYLDLTEDHILFLAKEKGKYSIKLYMMKDDIDFSRDYAELLSQKEFVVYSANIDCEIHTVGTALKISLNGSGYNGNVVVGSASDSAADSVVQDNVYHNIYLLHYDEDNMQDNQFRYNDVLSDTIFFSNPEIGRYDMLLDDVYVGCYKVVESGDSAAIDTGVDSNIANGMADTDFNILSGSTNDAYYELSQTKRYYEDKSHDEILQAIGANTDLQKNDSNILSYKLKDNRNNNRSYTMISDSSGKFKNTFIVLRDNINNQYIEGNLLDINSLNNSGEDYQMDIYFSNSTLKRIRLNRLNYSKGVDMSVEDLSVENLMTTKVSRGDFIDAFAIDPARVQFTDAVVTFTAVGNALWKCKDYEFSTRTCSGDFIKILDMIPGREYSFILTPEDPVFAQSNYLINPSFTYNTSGWTTLNEVTCPNCGYAWVASDGAQSGVAEIYNTGNARNATLNYYQMFNLTIPQGTNLTNITFSTLWRISNYDQPGVAYFWIQNLSRTSTYCAWSQPFSSTTGWATTELRTNGSNGCFLSNFTKNYNYTVRLRCNIVTSGATRNERCHWDDINVTAFYIDVQSPTIILFNDSPDPVNYSQTINFTANITDNIQVDNVWLFINGTYYFMNYSGTIGIYYFDTFNTSIYPRLYTYTIYANDTSNNTIFNNTKNFTINDNLNPRLYIVGPEVAYYSNVTNNYFYYNVSDESIIANCSLRVDGLIVATNFSVQRDIQQSLNATLSQGVHYWNITCYDNSTNKNSNTSYVRNITVDTTLPRVALNTPRNNTWVSGYVPKIIYFNYTPVDQNLQNCSLYGNFSGAFIFNQTNTTPINASFNIFQLYLNDGIYRWNVQCCDKAKNCAFNNTNFTVGVDSTSPYWSNNLTNPPSESTWSLPRIYQFNVTWNDALTNMSRVWIEHNFSGPLQNYSALNISNVYRYNISNLSAGSYTYRWYANDTLNNINSTDYYTYIVNRAPSTIRLLFNGTDGDMDIGQGDSVNITANIMTPSQGYIELYQDGILINSGMNILTNITIYTSQQRYNITAIYPSTQNYSESISTHFITVTDTISPTVALGGPQDYSWNPRTVILYYTPEDNIDITNCTLILDGITNITQNSTIDIENNFTINVSDGIHNWTVGCRDSKNNYGQNNTVKYIRVDTMPPSAFSLSIPLNTTIDNDNTPLLNWSQTVETNFLNYTVMVDNSPNFLIPDYIYYTFNITNNTYAVTSANPWEDNIWYWRVTAYDLVENSYSTGYFVYTLDTQPSVINIISPQNNRYSNNLTQDFIFTVTDFTEITNCSLYINDVVDRTNYSVNKSVTQTFTKTFAATGTYNWSIECYDQARNRQMTVSRYLYIDQTPPSAFSLSSPTNLTLSNNNTPLLSWSQTTDENFGNYTVQLSDISSFAYSNFTYVTLGLANITYAAELFTDALWYWRVIAYDKAGNNYTTGYYSYEVDTLPPAAFSLTAPIDMTSTNNTSPLLNWTQTYDKNFRNYTIYVSDNPSYLYNNFTYSKINITNTTYQASNWLMNVVWYWKVVAFDGASNNYTTGSYTYITDNSTPVVSLVSPANNSVWNASTTISFIFNVSDISPISNCSLILNGEIVRPITDIERYVNQTIYEGLTNGQYNWSINCTDSAGYEGKSSIRNLTVNVTLPRYIFYETSNSVVAQLSDPAIANLSTNYDYVENYVQSTINGIDYNIANASIMFNGSGFLLYPNTQISLSGVFQAGSRNIGRVNWGVYIQNSSGVSLICQTPNGTSGVLITTRNAKETKVGSCTSPNYNIRFTSGDSLILRVNIYSASSVTYMHYMDNANPSYLQVDGYKLGVLNVTLANITDQQPGEGYAFIERCNVTCTDGYCLDVEAHYELNNSATQNYTLIGDIGNIILNGSQYNPAILATVNSTIIANASLFANTYSANNSFRCYAESTYSNATSNTKNITVKDVTYPTVGLISPGITYAADPGMIEFSYIPFDKRLKNCTIYTNASSSWSPNQTNSTPLNGTLNRFYLNFSQYGRYLWNIQCCDIVGNCAFNESNRTLNVAGDLEITDSNVYFSDNTPSEFENITIFAKIYNLANRTERDVLVRFYENDPDISGTPLGDAYANITGLSNTTVNISWIVSKGAHYFYVKIDPLDSIIESDETNNKAYNATFTAIWQTYYGNVTIVLKSLGFDNKTITNWTLDTGITGNIFIADSDSAITWTTLQALTRDIYDTLTSDTTNDFEDIDTCLNTASYDDNINTTYSINGLPKATSTYDIYNRLVDSVPDSQSTNSTNFYTGILWDVSDSANDYYSCNPTPSLREDIVFVSKINEAKDGGLGNYDYEIKVPGELGTYKGASTAVSFYYEII
jgi:hypothetical protein